MTSTFERLRAILIKDYKLAPDLLVPEAPLAALGIDSLATAELLFNIEDAFGVTLPPDAVQLTTLGDVVAYIDALASSQRKGPVQPDPVADLAPTTA
jgi:acyl carrier protein